MHYVPRLIAVAYVIEREQRNGLLPISYIYARLGSVAAEPSVSLANIALRAGVDYKELMSDNFGLFNSYTPPVNSSRYLLKAPHEQLARLSLAMVEEVLARGDTPIFYNVHTITERQTIRQIAKIMKVSRRELLFYNPHLNNRFRAGDIAIVPKQNVEITGYYIVQRGDNLWRISLRFGIHVNNLARFNDLQVDNILRLGTRINVPL
jgi:hypothetical protein